MDRDAEEAFNDYVAARRDALIECAYLMCGDWHRAEDAVQSALIKLYGAWARTRRETADAYTRRIVTNTLIDETRRAWFRRERATPMLPEYAFLPDEGTDPDRGQVLAALAALPVRQRATLVLRFWEDQSVEETARLLRCSASTVKSQTASGLRTLRGMLAEPILTARGVPR